MDQTQCEFINIFCYYAFHFNFGVLDVCLIYLEMAHLAHDRRKIEIPLNCMNRQLTPKTFSVGANTTKRMIETLSTEKTRNHNPYHNWLKSKHSRKHIPYSYIALSITLPNQIAFFYFYLSARFHSSSMCRARLCLHAKWFSNVNVNGMFR